MLSFFTSFFTPATPAPQEWSIDLLNDPNKHHFLFGLDVSVIPPCQEIHLRLAKEVKGWNPVRNVFTATANLEVLLACLEASDGEEWLAALTFNSVLKQCRHNEFSIRAFELYPDYLINVPGILHVLDAEVFETEEFREALTLDPDVVYNKDSDGCTFLENYKHWSVSGLKNIRSAIGETMFSHIILNSNMEYTLEPDVIEFLRDIKRGNRRVTRSMKLI